MPSITTFTDLMQILSQIQETSATHVKYAVILKNAFDNNNADELFEELCKCLAYSFQTECNGNIYMDRIISFTSQFAVLFKAEDENDSDMHPVLHKLFKFILRLSRCNSETHRYWSCKLFNEIFKHLDDLSVDLYEEVTESMLERLTELKAAIRCQAIIAMYRLQDPEDLEDPVTVQLCALGDSDSNGKVRELCVEKIALNKHGIKLILHRIRDTDCNVRLAAYGKLCPLVKYLNISQRRLILLCGFKDPSEKIRDFVSNKLLKNWCECYNNDYLKLVSTIRLDACEQDIKLTTELAELMLRALFQHIPVDDIIHYINLNEKKFIEYDQLNWDTVLYYRIVIQFLRKPAFEDALNTVLPELIHFCEYIKGYVKYVKNQENFDELLYQFTLQQLFMITQGYDVSDVASEHCLNSLIVSVLQNEYLPPDVSEIIIRNLEKTIPNVKKRSVFVCEIISNIIYGEETIDYEVLKQQELERSHTISQLQSEVLSLRDQEQHYVHVEKNFVEAERIKCELEEKQNRLKTLSETRSTLTPESEKKTDADTMLKFLSISEALFRSPKINEPNPALTTLNTEHISPALIHNDDEVKAKALKCYGMYCLIDQRTARYGIHLFSYFVVFSDVSSNIEILLLSMMAVVDILTLYGMNLLEKREEEEEEETDTQREEIRVFVGGTTLTDLMQAMANHLDHEDQQVQEVATKCICTLLTCRMSSSSLLSRIILKWANPATDNVKIKKLIGVTLNTLTTLQNFQLYFANGVLDTIKVLVYAPTKSPLADVDVNNVIKFMITLCALSPQNKQIQTELAFKICERIRAKPNIKISPYLAKTLQMLTIAEDERTNLLHYCNELRNLTRNQPTIKIIDKIVTSIQASTAKNKVQS